MQYKMKISTALLASLLFSLVQPVSAESLPPVLSKAPPLHDCEVSNQVDFGAWDDAFVCNERDLIILRRSDTLYSLLMREGARPIEMAKVETLAHTHIVACISSGEKIWLFLNSTETGVFAIDAKSGKLADFKIPNLAVPGSCAPIIQSYVAVPHADAVILMITGGDRETWPRDGNRPVYFWMSLESGNVVRFPIGWDLDYFSEDQRIAVLQKLQEVAFRRRPLQSVNMQTGEYLVDVPNRNEGGYILFSWTETRAVKAIYMHRAGMGDHNFFEGVSVNGRALSTNIGLDKNFYLSQAMEKNGFVGFRLEREGSAGEPSPFWLVKAEEITIPEQVTPIVEDFTILEGGNCVFSTPSLGAKRASSESFFRAFNDKSMWNVLDGVTRLPALEREFAEKDFVEDQMTVRLVPSLGSGSPIVLCLFQHSRSDMRSPTFGLTFPTKETTIKRELWRRAVILTSTGKRYMTSLYPEGLVPPIIWLHRSGILFTCMNDADGIHLSSCHLELQDDAR